MTKIFRNSTKSYFILRLILTLLLFVSCLPTTAELSGLIFRRPGNEHHWYDWLRFQSHDFAFAAAIVIMCVLFLPTVVSLILNPSARSSKFVLIFSGMLLLFNVPYVLGAHPRELSDLMTYAILSYVSNCLKIVFYV